MMEDTGPATVASNAGSLMEIIAQAAEQVGARPETRVHVRIGRMSTEHEIRHVRVSKDERGIRLILEADVVPIG